MVCVSPFPLLAFRAMVRGQSLVVVTGLACLHVHRAAWCCLFPGYAGGAQETHGSVHASPFICCKPPVRACFALTACLSSCVCKLGLPWHQVAQSRGKRCSAASSYLKEAMGRKNLDVETSAQITKVCIPHRYFKSFVLSFYVRQADYDKVEVRGLKSPQHLQFHFKG